jgi:hypothetical protein
VQALGLFADAALTPANGDTTTATLFTLNAHATDGDGSISLLSLDWGDGTALVKGTRGTACEAKAPADCRDFEWTHKYAAMNTDGYDITLKIQSGDEVSTMHLVAYVNGT